MERPRRREAVVWRGSSEQPGDGDTGREHRPGQLKLGVATRRTSAAGVKPPGKDRRALGEGPAPARTHGF